MSYFLMLIILLWLSKRMNVFVLREHTLKCLWAKEGLHKKNKRYQQMNPGETGTSEFFL